MQKKMKKGFTILELLVVVAIIAILAVIALPNFMGQMEKAKASRELAEINAVTKAVNMYYADKGTYPTLQGKDGTLLQPQPMDGSPHNIDFSSLVPDYLASLPNFSYWWVDYTGEVYHTEKAIGTVASGVFTPTTDYTYTLYRPNGTTQVLSAPYTLLAGEYVIGKDAKGVELPKVSSAFKNALMHPQDPEYIAPVVFTSQTFAFTGAVQPFTVQVTGNYKLEVWGAQGGGGGSYRGGYGGYSVGNTTLSVGEVLYVYVGSQGATDDNTGDKKAVSGGWNGGGIGIGHTLPNYMSGGGGGASDIRFGGQTLADRKIVAGGGGGSYAGSGASNGGAGGDLAGGAGTGGATGGTQTSGGSTGGSFGIGGSGGTYLCGGGGGGYYGGGIPTTNGVGAGGSGYIGGVTGGSMSAGVQIGNGKVVITYVGP